MSKTTTDHDEIRRWAQERGGFEKERLALLYEDTTKDGKESRFFKLVNR